MTKEFVIPQRWLASPSEGGPASHIEQMPPMDRKSRQPNSREVSWSRTPGVRLWRHFRPVLRPASWLYGRVALLRRHGLEPRARTLPAPVISVGNITCGGTGKTPTAEMIARHLLQLGRRPALLSRGYGHMYTWRRAAPEGGEPSVVGDVGNDEFHVLAANLPSVAHYQGKDRYRNGLKAIEGGADVLILDDGFQHFRIRRDLNLVLIDALSPFGGGEVLPAGLLREPLEVLARADLFGLTRSDLADAVALSTLSTYLRRRWQGIPQVFFRTRAVGWRRLSGEASPADSLGGSGVLAFCGIGNPAAFERQLLSLGVRVVDMLCFRDHHRYTEADIERIHRRALQHGVDTVVTTQKDAVKIPVSELTGEWRFLLIEQEVARGEEDYREALQQSLSRESEH